MANEVQINIGSFSLSSTNNIAISDITSQVTKSIRATDLAKFAGAIIPIAKRKSLTLRVKGTIIGTNYDALRTSFDSLKAALELDTAEYKFTTDDDRFIRVQYSSFSHAHVRIRTFISFQIEFIASYPFWLAETASSDSRVPTSTVAYNITNNGNAPARLKVTITNGSGGSVVNNIKFENVTTGASFNYRGTVLNTKAIVVNNFHDTTDLVVTNDGVDDIKNHEGDFLTLAPGVNSMKFTGASTQTVLLNWRDTYY